MRAIGFSTFFGFRSAPVLDRLHSLDRYLVLAATSGPNSPRSTGFNVKAVNTVVDDADAEGPRREARTGPVWPMKTARRWQIEGGGCGVERSRPARGQKPASIAMSGERRARAPLADSALVDQQLDVDRDADGESRRRRCGTKVKRRMSREQAEDHRHVDRHRDVGEQAAYQAVGDGT